MAQDSQNTGSLFDFFYIDRDRVSSLTAQIFGSGVITSVKQTEAEGDKSSKGLELSVKIAKAKFGSEDTFNSSQERLFDASWSLPLNLLDRLSELSMIKSSLTDARRGDLILSSGMIKIFDIGLVQQMLPAAKKIARHGNKSNQGKKQESDLAVAEEIIKFLPKSVQIDMADTDGNILWMSVAPENMTIPTGDLILKYGPMIPGKWHVLGMLDAHAEDTLEDPDAPYPNVSNQLKASMDYLGLMMRSEVGRPMNAFGMTPLLIFRKIK